jgi:CubicO group peptidase (beta-lactamase class C family)
MAGVARDGRDVSTLNEAIDGLDELATTHAFSGVVRVEDGNEVLTRAYGCADRAHGIANTDETRFGIASGTKGFTAVTIASLIEDGTLALDTTARSLLGDDLPLIAGDVTVEHLLGHRSGIGDYVDEEVEEDVRDRDTALRVPVSELATTEAYVRALDGYPTKFAAGTRFSYCNAGYVVLALLAERATKRPFPELVAARVCVPAGMHDTAFLRSDELDGGTAIGYLDEDVAALRTNVFHLPVCGSGDGGIFTTATDVSHFWRALTANRLVGEDWVARLLEPTSAVPEYGLRYGLGFWCHPTRAVVFLEGMDAGVSFRSVHDRGSGLTHTVISNTTDGAWPVTRYLGDRLDPPAK